MQIAPGTTLVSVSIALLIAVIAPPAVAQDEELDGVDEITVTITKRPESIQDVAASVSAFDAQTIRDVNIEAVSDIATLIPGIVTKGEDRTGAISIRGVSSGFTGQSAVARHINGVFKRFPLSYSGQYYDLAGIEVQRGPQGTVYGRNATAGTINMKWNEPHADWEAFGDVTYGNYDLYHVRGGVNIPFLGEGDERLMGRLVFQREIRDGYLDNANLPDSRDPQDKDEWSVRFTLASNPTEDLKIVARGFWIESDAEPNTMAPLSGQSFPVGEFSAFDQLVPPINGVRPPFDIFNGLTEFRNAALATPTFLGALGTLNNPLDPFQGIANVLLNGVPGGGLVPPEGIPPLINDPAFFSPALPLDGRKFFTRSRFFEIAQTHLEIYGIDGEVDWHLGEIPVLGEVEFIISGGWEWLRITQVTDADGIELPIVDSQSPLRDNDMVTADARFVTTGEVIPVDLVLGYFYFQNRQKGSTISITPFGNFTTLSQEREQGDAIYGSATIHLAEFMEALGISNEISADLLGGARYNVDEQYVDVNNLAVPGLRGASALDGTARFREMTWEAGMRVFIGDDHTVYGKFSKGYKPGIQQLLVSSGIASPVEPEIIRGLEIGWKSTWLEGRATVNLTAFDYSYTNLQVPQLLGLQVVTLNAAGASNRGIELETTFQPTPDWFISANAGYLDATYDSFCASDTVQLGVSSPSCPPNEIDLSGNDLEDAPELKFSLLTTYTIDLGEYGTLKPILKFTWTDDYFLRPFNIGIDEVDSYTRTDLRLAWESASGDYSVELMVENIEDELVFARSTAGQDFAGGFAASLGGLAPRVYGIRLGYRWGGSN
jgi:iron complex outermembrane receptor protein